MFMYFVGTLRHRCMYVDIDIDNKRERERGRCLKIWPRVSNKWVVHDLGIICF